MTLRSSADVAFLLLGGRSILGRITTLTDTDEAVVEEITPLGVDSDVHAAIPGLRNWTLEQEGFYDDAVGSILEAFNLTGEQVIMYGYAGNVIGRQFSGASGVKTNFEKRPEHKAFTKLAATFMSDEGSDEGLIAAELAARTTVGPTATTTLDWGTAYVNQTTGKIIGYLAVPALTLDGGTSLTVAIRDSDDNVTFADSIVFTNVTLANASERKELLASAAVGADIERYIQVRHTFNGAAGANRSATFAVGVARPLA